MSRRIVRALLDSSVPQLDRLFDYEIPEDIAEVPIGARIRVPLRSGARIIDAFAIEIGEESDDGRTLAQVEAVTSPVSVLPTPLYALIRAVADRAAGSASDIVRVAIPKRFVRVERAWEPPRPLDLPGESTATADHVLAEYQGLREVLRGHARAAVEAIPESSERGPAWAQLLASAAVDTLARGKSAILIAPDYRDIAQLSDALSRLGSGDAIVRADSQQTGGGRYGSYLRMLDDAPCIVLGNRSAVYAPVRAGLVAIWDDGDTLLAEPLAPYAHPRDAALIRQEHEGSSLLFVAHTRSTDVQRLVNENWIADISAVRRVRPRVILSPPHEVGAPAARVTSAAFTAAKTAVADGPVLVQVARPGYAPQLVCATCRQSARCERCGGPLGARARGVVPVCAWCGVAARNWECSNCAGTTFRLSSSGSERTAEELGRAFPGVRVIVSDGVHQVERVDAQPALIIATRGAEPLAEGGYRAVILLDGARMLQVPDLRIGESCLRWWSNAAALAARDAPVHLVGVDGPVARALATWTPSVYATNELAERAPLRMPPTSRVGVIEGERDAIADAIARLEELSLSPDALLGPVPYPTAEHPTRMRALVRFDYSVGRAVAANLRAAVVAEAVKRRSRRSRLTVHLDILDPEL